MVKSFCTNWVHSLRWCLQVPLMNIFKYEVKTATSFSLSKKVLYKVMILTFITNLFSLCNATDKTFFFFFFVGIVTQCKTWCNPMNVYIYIYILTYLFYWTENGKLCTKHRLHRLNNIFKYFENTLIKPGRLIRRKMMSK